MSKYQEYVKRMFEENKALFEQFKKLHDYYAANPRRYQLAYNIEGEKVVEVIHDYERRICAHSEKGQYSKYSSTLAEKFWEQVRTYFPKIDFVGVQRS